MRHTAAAQKSLTGGCIACLTTEMSALAQEPPVLLGAQLGTAIPADVPFRVALERRVAIKRVGEPIQRCLVAPVYVFDRLAYPTGARLRDTK
jgi:hypothetical protein